MEEKVIEKESTDSSTTLEENVQETDTYLTEDKKVETEESVKEFDPEAFIQKDFIKEEERSKSNKEPEKEIEDEDNANEFTWDQNIEEKKVEVKEEVKPDIDKEKSLIIDNFDWTSTGLEGVTNAEEFKKKIDEWKSYEKEVKEYKTKNLKNDKINRLQEYLNLDDEALIKKDLELQGFTKEKLDKALETYKYNDTASIEAHKIRNTLNRAIKAESQHQLNANREKEAKLNKERDASVADLKKHLNGTETMFGFKMAKDESQLNNVRETHFEYITSGTFLKDITDSNKNLTEAAWLWKNKDTLLKAMMNKGTQQGKKEILDSIQRPEIPGTNRILDPSGDSDEFNPNKFLFSR